MHHEFAKTLGVRPGRRDVGAGGQEPLVDGVEMGDLEAEAHPVARRARVLAGQDREFRAPGRQECVAVVDHAHEHREIERSAIPLHEFRPPRRAEFDAEKLGGSRGDIGRPSPKP